MQQQRVKIINTFWRPLLIIHIMLNNKLIKYGVILKVFWKN